MIKESLYIYVSVDGVEKSFPVGEKAAVINEWTYNAQRMGGTPTITGTVMHPVCLDDLWTKTEYVKLNGEKFYINQVPTSSKNTDDVRYKHEISLVSERVKLENIYFFDVVTANTDTQYQDRYRSNSTEFSFYGDLAEFVARLNDSLVYSGLYNDGFKVVIDSGVSAGVKEISLSNVYMATALQEIYKTYGLPYYWVGKICHVGYTENAIPTIFEYGQGKGLLSISKANANYRIFNRITGTGSSDNIPHYYPNKAEDRNDPANGGVWIAPTDTLMPPIYRESKGAKRFYNALNNTYNAPDGGKYIFSNLYTADNPMEGIQAFADIKPTINGITNSAGQLFGEIAGIAFDSDDSDEVDDKGDYIHSYFYVKLHIFNGTYGFNLFKHALAQGGMTFNMTSGNCAPCAFEVGVSDPKLVDGHYEIENPVQVTESGNIVAGSYSDKVNFGNIQPRQQDTSQYEVWVALKKENTTFGVVMPNATNNYKPSVGDTFVITNISMPYVYITKAENDLKDALIQYMSENNDEKFTFSITFSRIYLTRNPDTAALLNENARIIVRYNEKDYTLYVTNYTCKADGNILTEVTVELDEKLSISQNQLKEQMESIAQKYAAGNADSKDILARGQRYFLRKDVRDTAQKQIVFNEGLQLGPNFIPGLAGIGGRLDGEGRGEMRSLTLWEWLEVPELRFNKVSIYIGVRWDTFGGGIIEEITPDATGVETGTGKLKLEDGEYGAIAENDLCMGIWHDTADLSGNETANSDDHKGSFTFAGFKTVYFQITSVSGANNENFTYVLRSRNDGGNGIHPFVGMHFAGRGNTTNKERQAFIYSTTEYAVALTGVNTWEFQPSNYYEIKGHIEGFTMPAIDANGNPYTKVFHGYGTVLGNAYIFGQIDQFERIAYRCFIDQSLGGMMAPGETETVTVTILNGYGEDVTSKFTLYSVTRNTGDAASDAVWNAAHENVGNPFQIAFSDLGIDGIHQLAATFTVTATDEATDNTAQTQAVYSV